MLPSETFDFSAYWTWFLIWTRMTGVFIALIGVGTDQVPITIRAAITMVISLLVVINGPRAASPEHLMHGGVMILSEFFIGYLLAIIPRYIVSGITVAGQVTTGVIGLGQANMIDHSLGESVAILATLQTLIAVTVFLALDGHHAVILAAAKPIGGESIGTFLPNMYTAALLIERFQGLFVLSVSVAAPILVALLVTQFVLGIITKAVPQVNVFIVSLPLTIGMGLFILAYTATSMTTNLVHEFQSLEEYLMELLIRR